MTAAARSRGFTLIELLVVVALIGVITAAVVLTVPSRSTAELQHTEAQRLQARMTLAREEAVLRARTFGLHVESDGYAFVHRGDTGWQRLDPGHPLQPRRLPAPLRLELDIDGRGTSLGASDDGGRARDESAPQLFFLAGGEIRPGYTLRVLGEDSRVEYTIAPGEEEWTEVTERRY